VVSEPNAAHASHIASRLLERNTISKEKAETSDHAGRGGAPLNPHSLLCPARRVPYLVAEHSHRNLAASFTSASCTIEGSHSPASNCPLPSSSYWLHIASRTLHSPSTPCLDSRLSLALEIMSKLDATTDLESVLENRSVMIRFRQFLASIFSVENMTFWLEAGM